LKRLLIKLTPTEPYFFGGERIFEIGDKNKHYYIRSLDTPSQTMLFGVLRYLAIENPITNTDFRKRYDNYRNKVANKDFKREFHGFALNRPNISFHKIHCISPLYLLDDQGNYYIRTPFDHKVKNSAGEKNEIYTPFSACVETICTTSGKRTFPKDYVAKDGIADSWLSLTDKTIKNCLFTGIAQTGIQAIGYRKRHSQTNENGLSDNDNHALFKKEYKRLEDGFSFAFFADIEDDMPLHPKAVYMGQDKSTFLVSIEPSEDPPFPTDIVSTGRVYAQSDIYYAEDVSSLYSDCKFVAVKTRDHRIFQTNNLDRKYSKSIKLIQAGSMFIPNDINNFKEKIQNPHASIAGFNKIITGGTAQ
jgi:hypothetical protein